MPPKKTFFEYKEEEEEGVLKVIAEIGKGAKMRETRRKYNIPQYDGG